MTIPDLEAIEARANAATTAVGRVSARTPCRHDTYENLGFVWGKCYECGARFVERLPLAAKAADTFESAIDDLTLAIRDIPALTAEIRMLRESTAEAEDVIERLGVTINELRADRDEWRTFADVAHDMLAPMVAEEDDDLHGRIRRILSEDERLRAEVVKLTASLARVDAEFLRICDAGLIGVIK